ncbi:hypothetical protein GQ457_01G021130 [Hibiscus cannabinus]
MFDLAIKTTLESKNPSRPTHSPLAFCADSSSLRESGCAIFLVFREGRDFTLRLKIQSSHFKKKSSFDFSPGIHCSAQSPGFGNEGVRFAT